MHPPNPISSLDSDTAKGLPPLAPDFIEQDFPEELDDIIPTRGYQMVPMVGLGGSAGSIPSLIKFFRLMPSDSGMVFVVVLHLSPAHESTLPGLLGRVTGMDVNHARDGQKVEPNHVYVIPPGKYIATVNGHLKLVDLQIEWGRRSAIDLFFRSLADTHGPHAAAVVLSGADGDGAVGIKRIKERGGLTIAQDPQNADCSEMPRAAIDTGMVDWVLDVEQLPVRLVEYFDHQKRTELPSEDGPASANSTAVPPDAGEAALRDVLVFLRMRTGRDFLLYKRATVLRRIARRMQVNGVAALSEYLNFLRTNHGEAVALVQDLLVSVTNFFRDPAVIEAMAQQIPGIFDGKRPGEPVRIWVPACATGEEAYSLAILFLEQSSERDAAGLVQVFACDLNDEAIRKARAGHYPEAIAADVSEERLRRFFVKDSRGYQVRRELREMVLFSSHDLLKDAPFSRMDLISCRNLMIYLNSAAQQRVLNTFHFALRPAGRLLLGASEAVDDGNALFRVLDKKNRIYIRQPVARTTLPVPTGMNSISRAIESQKQVTEAPVVHGKRFADRNIPPLETGFGIPLDRASLAELHFRLVERYAPPSVMVNAQHDIVHLSEHAARFLRFSGGEPTMNLLRIVNPALRLELRAALFRASETNATVETMSLPVEIDGEQYKVRLRVLPAHDIASGFILVMFDLQALTEGGSSSASSEESSSEPLVRLLDRELEQVKAQLRETIEQYECATEELKASNEELQSMNEELRAATEELETSREELQSINEELTTVNVEMKGKVDELAQANSDLQNLMAATSIATVFLDRRLTITRYTPSAVDIFHLIPGDIGRPLAHLRHGLEYPELIADAEQALRSLVPVEREVRADSHWFLVRLLPYRNVDEHVAGVVVTLINLTDRYKAAEALRLSEERLRLLVESAKDYAIFTTDRKRVVDSWNSGAESLFGYSEREIIGRSADILFTPEDRTRGDAEREIHLAAEQGLAQNERWHAREDGSRFYGSGSVMPLRDESGALLGFVKIMRDLTESKLTEQALKQHMEELTRFNKAAVGRETRMIELKKEINDLCSRLGEEARYLQSVDDMSDLEQDS